MVANRRFVPLAAALLLSAAPAIASIDKPESIVVPVPPAGKAEVVFFRAGGFVGSAISCAVREGDTKISSLPPGRFFIMVAEPGKHTYSSTSSSDNGIYLNVNAGEVHYVRCTILPGFWAGKGSLDVAKDEDFNTKLWKSVDPTRMSGNVLTDAQINAASSMQAASAPASVPATAPVPSPITAPLTPASMSGPASIPISIK